MFGSIYRKFRIAGLLAIWFIFTGNILAQQGNVNLLLSVKHSDYAKVIKAVQNVKGQVKIQHKYADVLAVSLPADQASKITAMSEVKYSEKDAIVTLPVPPRLNREKYGDVNGYFSMAADKITDLRAADLKRTLEVNPDTYYPYTNKLTNTIKFYNQTGHYGEGVIVAIIDAGVSSAANAVSSRIIGGESFVDDGLSATSPLNGSHGTWVACCIGANAVFGFGNPAIQNAVKNYAPNSVVPDYFAKGIDGIPMIGEAPEALFYSLKVFPYNSNSTSRSIIAAALERAIELKEQYNSGSGGVNIKIVNMSLGGGNLFAGEDPFYAPLITRAINDGILIVVSAGNDGPSGMTISTPGDSKNIITSGATADATEERIVRDLQYGHDIGYLYRPTTGNQIAYFSSRGPNADGRPDPDLVAPGWYRFAQNPDGKSVSWVSGTSFSCPTTAGAAALLLSARPQSTPAELRAALLNGADKGLVKGNPGRQDQGYGFLDVYSAYKKLTAGVYNPPDYGIARSSVILNVQVQNGIDVIKSNSFSANTGLLSPGQRAEYYYAIPNQASKVTVNVSNIAPALPSDQQNSLFGDDIMFAIHSAKTSFSDYLGDNITYLNSDKTYVLDGQDLDKGMLRITILGDWTNAGSISANISITTDFATRGIPRGMGDLVAGQVKQYNFSVDPGTTTLNARLEWDNGWDKYPTNDLDIYLYDPTGKIVKVDNNNDGVPDGSTWNMPEKISISNPLAGKWTAAVAGFSIWYPPEHFMLYINQIGQKGLAKSSNVNQAIPAEYKLDQNYPNPFNPTTEISYALADNAYTSLKVYNGLGQLVRTLVDGPKEAGYYHISFDGRDNSGSQLPSGMYIYQLSTEKFVKSGKMLMIK